MSRRTRVAVWLVRAAFVSALGLELLALHFPTPSGVDEASRADVRGAWAVAGRVGRAGGRFIPDALDPLFDDKAAHFLLFLPLGMLIAIERRLHGPLTLRMAGALVLGLGLYAALGEASQAIGGRYAEVGDWVANALGGLVGIALVVIGTRAPRRPAAPAVARAAGSDGA